MWSPLSGQCTHRPPFRILGSGTDLRRGPQGGLEEQQRPDAVSRHMAARQHLHLPRAVQGIHPVVRVTSAHHNPLVLLRPTPAAARRTSRDRQVRPGRHWVGVTPRGALGPLAAHLDRPGALPPSAFSSTSAPCAGGGASWRLLPGPLLYLIAVLRPPLDLQESGSGLPLGRS